ncbi:MAG: hypothetical protein JWO72_3227 [Caulobacteraceae bacterium]|nr:hypothetical protein [Caulobacteraceae bacterium]
MIRYALLCEHDHDFEGWFGSSDDYDDQQGRGLLECPACGSKAVRKAMMAPAVVGAKAGDPPAQMREMMMQAAQAVRQHVEDNFDYVGDQFASEARAMHQGQTDERGIYGEASSGEIRALVEEGVPVAPLAPRPPRKSEVN